MNPDFPMGRAKSAFSTTKSHGRIYVEALQPEDVQATIRGVSGVYRSRVRMVPQELMRALLEIHSPPSHLVGTWVRVQAPSNVPCKYHGDLALVTDIQEEGEDPEEKYMVVCVPRENKQNLQRVLTSGQIGQCQRRGAKVASFQYDGSDVMSQFYYYKGHTYSSDGFVYFGSLRRKDLVTTTPSRDNLDLFRHCIAASWAYKGSTSLGSWEHATYKRGDTVLINDGSVGVRLGVVRSHDHLTNVCTVLVKDLGIELDFPSSSLRLGFSIGDTVCVDVGEHEGRWGWIVGKRLPQKVDIFVTAMREIVSILSFGNVFLIKRCTDNCRRT